MRWFALVAFVACGRDAPITKQRLGERLFDDPRLSEPAGQACADCHVARVAFADPEDDRTSAGVIRDRFGVRNAQPIMYSQFVPPLYRDGAGRMIGGLFWDGRASTLEAQAEFPLLNPLEMNNPSKTVVVEKVRAHHGRAFRDVFGEDAFDDVDHAFDHIKEAIAAFERTRAFAPFSSKYDRFSRGAATFDDDEARGLALFGKHCTSCHAPPLFTTFGYVNLGVPRFNDNPFYRLQAPLNADGDGFIDHGLAATTGDPRHDGMFRIPSLRDVARTTPYAHNGYFRRLDEMIAFHATATGTPEIAATVDRSALAAFAPTKRDLADLVAFLETLTDATVEGAELAASR
jgi:cytochrome c peroxidase